MKKVEIQQKPLLPPISSKPKLTSIQPLKKNDEKKINVGTQNKL